jgi:hypothetical protein
MLAQAAILLLVLSADAGSGAAEMVLPPGNEKLATTLIGSHLEQERLPGGWILTDIEIEQKSIKYTFRKDERSFELVLGQPGGEGEARSQNFGVRIEEGRGSLSKTEAGVLLDFLVSVIRNNDNGPSPWAGSSTQGISPMPMAGSGGWAAEHSTVFSRVLSWFTGSAGTHKNFARIRITSDKDGGDAVGDGGGAPGDLAVARAVDRVAGGGRRPLKYPILLKQYETRLPIRPVLFYQIVFLAAMVLVVTFRRTVADYFRKVSSADWVWLGAWMLAGLALRLLGGIKIPAHINGHGYPHVYAILYAPPDKVDFWGVANYSLHGLLQLVIPYGETTVAGVHVFFSVLTIPAIYAVSMLWLRSGSGARAAAAICAVLPSFAYFAASDERYVPGVFFLSTTLIVTGLAIRDGRIRTWATAALLGVFTAQFQPFMRMVPLAILAMVVSDPRGRTSLRGWKPWAATGVLCVLLLDSVLTDLVKVETGQGPARNPFQSLGLFRQLLLPPGAPLGPPGNTFFDYRLTPPLFSLLAVAGAAYAFANRRALVPTLAIMVTALVYTFPGLMLLNVASARLQLQAQPFYILLIGQGVSLISDFLRSRRLPKVAADYVLPVALIAGAAAVWPGPAGKVFTPQLERRAIIEGLSAIEDGCRIFWPAMKLKSTVPMPVYLTLERGRLLDWRQVWNTEPPPPVDRTRCMIYYRPAACFDREPTAPEDDGSGAGGLRYECAELERKMDLKPLFLKRIPARPDAMQQYSRDPIEIGFFRFNLE